MTVMEPLTGRELTTLTADIPVPSEEGVFTAKVLFGNAVQTSYYERSSYDDKKNVTNPTIQVYGSPKFTSFKIPNAGISKEDFPVTAVVKGANFKAPRITASDFSVSCATASITDHSAITIIDDATLKVSLTIQGWQLHGYDTLRKRKQNGNFFRQRLRCLHTGKNRACG